MNITAFELAERFVGTKEVDGVASNPQIMAMLKLDQSWPTGDDVPWCSAFVNYIAWLLRLPRSKSLAARSWLGIGIPITLAAAVPGFDVVILSRGTGIQPGPEVLNAPGHVGFFGGTPGTAGNLVSDIFVLGGNQRNSVELERFPMFRVLGVRRLLNERLQS